MSEQCAVSCELELNNDIMGIGVRVALYAQIILAWGMSLKYPNTFIKNSRSAYMTATALLVASLIEWKTQSLSLFDAIVVSLMSSMMTIFIVVSGTSREQVKSATGQSPRTTPTNPSAPPAETSTPPDSKQSPSASTLSPPQNISQSLTRNSTAAQPTSSFVAVPQAAPVAPPSVQPQTNEHLATAQASHSPAPEGAKPRRSNTQWFIRFCYVNIWGGWCFNLWKDSAHFGLEGPKVNCTTNGDIVIWVFGVEVHATSSGIRIAALVLVSILYFVAISSLFFTLENIANAVLRMFSLIGSIFIPASSKVDNTTPGETQDRSLHEDPALNNIHYFLHLFAFGTLLYLLISIEMTVRTNDKERETMEWSYGQVIALILLLQQFMDLCSTIVESREEKETEKERANQNTQPSQVDAERQDNIWMNNLTPTAPNFTRPTSTT